MSGMSRGRAVRAALGVMGFVALVLVGCEHFKFHGVVKTSTTINGKTTTREVHVDNLEDFGGALSDAADDLSNASTAIYKELTEAPPPGKVRLSHIAPGLKRYQGKQGFDFLYEARRAKKQEFTYVRLGVPAYDNFFRRSAEIYALTWQLKQTIVRLKQLAGAVLNEKVDAEARLTDVVTRALGVGPTGANKQLLNRLEQTKALGLSLVQLAPDLLSRVVGIVNDGKNLIAGAATALLSPKALANLGLIKDGLTQSLEVLGESAGLMKELVEELATL